MRRFDGSYQAMSDSTGDPTIVLLGTNQTTLETVYEKLMQSAESRRLSRPVDSPYYVKEDVSRTFPTTVLPPAVDENSLNCHERPLREIIQKVIELFGQIQCFLLIWNAAEIRFGLDEKALFENLKRTVGDDAAKSNTVMLLVNAKVLLKTDRLEDFLQKKGNKSLQDVYTQLGGKMFAVGEENYQEIVQPIIRTIKKPVTRILYPCPFECFYQSFLILKGITAMIFSAIWSAVRFMGVTIVRLVSLLVYYY